ncbi:AraC family transcriptional regulator [Pseudonocardia sp. TRM90224]|uniref:AraC family transcriptional regulator n=1 Tax=Pseudonocardia sp. TRM90224 TaxID=2812678 RepID=UPI001E543D05|nr:helix-turn-helix transcriptional regulator [Pseudonocardia sp. TRM90224]
MSISRQPDEPTVRGYSVTHPPGAAVLTTEPGWSQLLYTARGAVTVVVADEAFTIPPHRALWLPDNTRTTVTNRGRVAVRCLYFVSSVPSLPAVPRVVNVPRFCRELLLHIVERCPLDLADPVHDALLTVLLDQLEGLPDAPLRLPLPSDPRGAAAAAADAADPTASTAAVAARAGTSRRTLERIFAAETGLGLGAWRRRAHILASLELLALGSSVTQAGGAVGYTTPSAYVAAFKRELGTTPRGFHREV